MIIDPIYHQQVSKYFLVNIDTMSLQSIVHTSFQDPGSLEDKRVEIRELLNMVVVQQRNFQRNIDVSWKQAEELAIEIVPSTRNLAQGNLRR